MNDKPRRNRAAQVAALAAAVALLSVSLGITSGPVSAQKKPMQKNVHAQKLRKGHNGGKKSKKGSSTTPTTTNPK